MKNGWKLPNIHLKLVVWSSRYISTSFLYWFAVEHPLEGLRWFSLWMFEWWTTEPLHQKKATTKMFHLKMLAFFSKFGWFISIFHGVSKKRLVLGWLLSNHGDRCTISPWVTMGQAATVPSGHGFVSSQSWGCSRRKLRYSSWFQ